MRVSIRYTNDYSPKFIAKPQTRLGAKPQTVLEDVPVGTMVVQMKVIYFLQMNHIYISKLTLLGSVCSF